MKKNLRKDYWFWLAGAVAFLILVILFAVITVSNSRMDTSGSTTEATESLIDEREELEITESIDVDAESSDKPVDDKPTETQNFESEPESTSTPEPSPPSKPSQVYTKPSVTPTCYHEEDGRCWDDLEDEAYSVGLYDRQFGYYGASLEYAENCNAVCRAIIEDAYDEGWYDGY